MPNDHELTLSGEPVPRRVPTLESIWAVYGPWLRGYIRTILTRDPETVDAACYGVLVRAGVQLLEADESPRHGADLSWWLEAIANEVAADVRVSGVPPEWRTTTPLPGALPAGLTASLYLRAAREEADWRLERLPDPGPIVEAILEERRRVRDEFEEWLRGFPAGLVVLRRWAERRVASVRSWWRRAEASVSPLVSPSAPRLSSLLGAGSGLSDAAAVVTAVVAAALLGPSPAPRVETPLLAAAATVEHPTTAPTENASAHPPSAVVARPGVDSGSAASAVPDSAPRAATPASPAAPAPAPAVPVPGPTVEAAPRVDGATQRVSEPIEETEHPQGFEYATPDERVEVDVDGDGDGDGDDDASVGTPYAFVTCPPPDQRGAVTGVACPVLEEADALEPSDA